jgi:glycosyltransferase involved in cell wall biosynthesis
MNREIGVPSAYSVQAPEMQHPVGPEQSPHAAPKTVLYFHHATNLGGAPRSLSLLLGSLSKSEFKLVVAMPRREGNAAVASMFGAAGATVIQERDIRPFHGSTVAPCATFSERIYALLGAPLTVRCARRVIEAVKPDLVHLNSTCLVAAALGARLAAPSTPVVAHVREPLLANWWGRLLAKLNRYFVSYFIGIDKAGLESVGGKAVPGTVIYNFVDQSYFDIDEGAGRQLRAGWGWPDDSVIFLALSRIAPSNGVDQLLDFIEQYSDQFHPAARFAIAGFEDEAGEFAVAQRQRAEMHPKVAAVPFMSDVHQLLAAADVVVAPFKTAHSARCVFEGAAAGRPGIVSRHPNLVELIEEGETGFSFDLNRPDDFVAHVNVLCGFSATEGARKTAEVYSRLIGEK